LPSELTAAAPAFQDTVNSLLRKELHIKYFDRQIVDCPVFKTLFTEVSKNRKYLPGPALCQGAS
jgi:hypothetical protein